MAVAFLTHLMQPLSRLISPLADDSTSVDVPGADPQDSTAPCRPASDLSASNPWVRASLRTVSDWIRQDSVQTSSLPIVAQLSASLHGSAQAFSAMCESYTQTAALLGIPEESIVNKLKHLMQPPEASATLSAENEELKKKLHDLSIKFERRIDNGIARWRAEEEKAAKLADSARVEITGLRQMLADERRANSDLVLAFEALRSSGTDTSAVKAFLAKRIPTFQRAAYVEAKSCLLKKIRDKYPDADMDYFANMTKIPEGIDLLPKWLEVPEGQFAYVSSLSAPSLLLNKRRRLR